MVMTANWDVIVVGGGLAGLTAGATAARAGKSVVVLEARQPGGRARTVEKQEFVFNMGAHALYTGGEAYAVLTGLGVTPAGAAPPLRDYKLLMDGELHTMPSGPGTLLRTTALSARSKAALAKMLAVLPRLKPEDHAGVSTDDWIAARGLRPDAVAVLKAITRISTYGPDFSELSAEVAILQMQRAAASGVLYLHGGWQPMIDALASKTDVRQVTVRAVRGDANGVEVVTDDGVLTGRTAIVAAGSPAATRILVGDPNRWPDAGEPLTAAALDAGVRGVPSPGYVLSVDDPIYGTTQSPPARQAPAGNSVVAVIRYGARNSAEDRPQMEDMLRRVGVRDDDIVTSRFLASMNVAGAIPRAANGGLNGRPSIDDSGMANVFLAGDWVGHEGFLADASFASGKAAALAAMRAAERQAPMMVS